MKKEKLEAIKTILMEELSKINERKEIIEMCASKIDELSKYRLSVRKPESFAAGIYYLVIRHFFEKESKTYKEVAEMFGVGQFGIRDSYVKLAEKLGVGIYNPSLYSFPALGIALKPPKRKR